MGDSRYGCAQRGHLWTVPVPGDLRRSGICQPDGLRGNPVRCLLGHPDFQRISFSLDLAVDGLDDNRTVTSATTPDAIRQSPRRHAKFSTATWHQMIFMDPLHHMNIKKL